MSKKKGLSLEEKRTRMLEIFFESKDVFQLKDIEKLAPKTKGITPMAVKEVLQSLVDDNMVDSERVGTSNYYWAFPSKALNTRQQRLEQLQQQISETQQRRQALQAAITAAQVGREESQRRRDLLTELKGLRAERDGLRTELDRLRDCDPELVRETERTATEAKAAAARWTDNVFAIKSWTKRKFNMDEKQVNKAFGISDDFDYMD